MEAASITTVLSLWPGRGVDARGVAQIRNPYLDAKFRQQYGDVGYYDQKAAIMDQIEGIISDPGGRGNRYQGSIDHLYPRHWRISASPLIRKTNANIVMNAFKGVTQVPK